MVFHSAIRFLVTVGLMVHFYVSFAQDSLSFDVAYNNHNIIIDGDYNDWNDVPIYVFTTPVDGTKYANTCSLSLLWDEDYFYVCIRVLDKNLIGLEKSNNPKRLHYNDSFEVYIDSQNDSQSLMDVNDYQFLIDINGNNAVFKGDRLNINEKHLVPKEAGIANIVFRTATSFIGTLNDDSDTDSLFIIETRIPWAGIGIDPKSGFVFKADFCVNDNDTLIDFRVLPEGPVPNYFSSSFLGNPDYGFPDLWIPVKLSGSPSFYKKLNKMVANNWLFLLTFSILSLLISFIVIMIKTKEIRQIPNREADAGEPLVSYIVSHKIPETVEQIDRPYLDKARNFIIKNIDQQIRIEDLAVELAMSTRNIQRLFQNDLNTTPKAFILTVKLEFAVALLSKPENNISEVAFSVGFADPSYFARVFKRYMSISPSQFQNEILNKSRFSA